MLFRTRMDKLGCWVYQGGDLPGGERGKEGVGKSMVDVMGHDLLSWREEI